MRQSGLADLLPSLRPETVYVGTSGGAMVATPDFGGATYDESEPLTGSDKALGLVDFSVFPHLDREDGIPASPLAEIEAWAAALSVPAYVIDDQTAIKVVDGNVDVVTEGHWKLITLRPPASASVPE
jgi:dipeptidase E